MAVESKEQQGVNSAPASMVGRSGFTVLEVLFGVIILAIGLLGVGAVIPGVIVQQRDAADVALAVNAMNEAEHAIRSNPGLRAVYAENLASGAGTQGFGQRLLNQNWSANQEWDIREGNAPVGDIDLQTGNLSFPPPVGFGAAGRQTQFFQTDRLWPKPPANDMDPMFVWDVVTRRTTPAEADLRVGPHRMQLAIFLRKIDPGIRVRANAPFGLVEVLEQSGPSMSPNDWRVAVAVDENGAPTLTGTSSSGLIYAEPLALDVDYDNMYRDRIVLLRNQLDPSTTTEQLSAVAVVNQRIVDNLGNVYRVTRVTSPNGGAPVANQDRVLFLDPPVDEGAMTTIPPGTTNPSRPLSIFKVAATVHTPVAVRVIDIVVQDEVVHNETGSGLR